MPLVNLFPFCLSLVVSEAVVHTSSTTDSFSGKVKNQYSSMNNLRAAVYSWMKGRAQLLPQFTKRWWELIKIYRPVSLLPVILKFLENLFFMHFDYFQENNLVLFGEVVMYNNFLGLINHEMIIRETFYWNHHLTC